jgi:hypothetical protein
MMLMISHPEFIEPRFSAQTLHRPATGLGLAWDWPISPTRTLEEFREYRRD